MVSVRAIDHDKVVEARVELTRLAAWLQSFDWESLWKQIAYPSGPHLEVRYVHR